VVPSAQNKELGAWWYKPSARRFLFCENKKNSVFRESEHHTALVWHVAAN